MKMKAIPTRDSAKRCRRLDLCSAFTLVEFIVTVAVLCLITALQLAANPHLKGQTQTAICSANLRRLGQAWLMYATDHRGALPGNFDGGSGTTNLTWCAGWLDFAGAPDNTNVGRMMQSQLGKYAQTPTIYRCPADHSLSRGTTGQPRVRSVSMNGYIGNPLSAGRPYTAGYRNFKTLDDFTVLPPSKAFVFTDEREDSINDGALFLSMSGYRLGPCSQRFEWDYGSVHPRLANGHHPPDQHYGPDRSARLRWRGFRCPDSRRAIRSLRSDGQDFSYRCASSGRRAPVRYRHRNHHAAQH
jgi:hypothetical protein